MKKELEDRILDIDKVKHFSNMALDRLMKYDRSEISSHYDEIVLIYCYLDEQLEEKYEKLSQAYYGCDN